LNAAAPAAAGIDCFHSFAWRFTLQPQKEITKSHIFQKIHSIQVLMNVVLVFIVTHNSHSFHSHHNEEKK